MKNFIIIAFMVFSIGKIDANQPTTKSFTFVLTHLENIKLKTSARFIAGDSNRWILDFRNGSKITYTITGRVGNNPMCGITSTDNFGDSCEICITKLSSNNVEVKLRYDSRVFIYKGYFLE